ncbi:MAG: tRNA threonylcarbamoyladenosine dehydratase [Thermodesulfobacteriota bacterium]
MMNDPFARTRSFLGDSHFERFSRSSATIVGIGAVGGHAAEALVRAGITSLRLVDFDLVQISNINRQIMALHSTIGQPKVEAARQRLLDINPNCTIEAMELFCDDESSKEILSPRPDLLIDCIDSLNPKCQLLVAAAELQLPTLSSMGAALRSDPTKIQVADIMESNHCPLAKRVRKFLRRRGVAGGIDCVYSSERVEFDYPQPAEEEPPATEHAKRGRKRNTLASLPTLTGIFGLTLANEAILRLSRKK